MLQTVAAALERAHVPYFLTLGTLLGAVRSQRIIPWTNDVDVCIPQSPDGFAIDSYLDVFKGGDEEIAACFDVRPDANPPLTLFSLYSRAPNVEVTLNPKP